MMTQQAPLLKSLHYTPQLYLKELLALNGPSTQVFHINPEKSTVLVGAKGTRLTFAPFSLTGLSGNPVKGMVEIRLKEALSQSDMLMAGRPTTSEDRLMESGGQLMIQASQGNKELKLAQPVTIGLPVSKKLRNPMSMRLFVGSTSTFQAYSVGQSFDWKMASDKAVRIRKVERQKYFDFQLHGLNWAGCDFFVTRRSNRCMVTARPISSVERFDSLLGYLVFHDIQAVARMYPGKHNCTAINIPEKLSATAHVIGLSRGRLFYGKGVIRRASEKLLDVKMRAVSEKDLIRALQNL